MKVGGWERGEGSEERGVEEWMGREVKDEVEEEIERKGGGRRGGRRR